MTHNADYLARVAAIAERERDAALARADAAEANARRYLMARELWFGAHHTFDAYDAARAQELPQ